MSILKLVTRLSFKGIAAFTSPQTAQQGKADEIKSWWDLINPKWKGKIIGYDPTIAGVARNVLWYLYMNKALGPEFMSKLYGDMQLTLSRDHRQLVDWLRRREGGRLRSLRRRGIGQSAKSSGFPSSR